MFFIFVHWPKIFATCSLLYLFQFYLRLFFALFQPDSSIIFVDSPIILQSAANFAYFVLISDLF